MMPTVPVTYLGGSRLRCRNLRKDMTFQVMQVISERETWLRSQGLALNAVIKDSEIQSCLTWCKSKYHASSDQLRRQERYRLAHKGASAAGSTG